MPRKLRILGIHGYGQTAEVFRKKTGGLRGSVDKLADFDFLDGPFPADEKYDLDGGFSWYRFSMGSETLITSLRHSLETINTTFRTNGPFDGVFGFSQGSSLLTVLCALTCEQQSSLGKSLQELVPDVRFNFCAMFSGFLPKDDTLCSFVKESGTLNVRNFHCFGSEDQIITPELSQQAVAIYSDAIVVIHDGGHFVPSKAPIRKAFKAFLSERASEINGEQA